MSLFEIFSLTMQTLLTLGDYSVILSRVISTVKPKNPNKTAKLEDK